MSYRGNWIWVQWWVAGSSSDYSAVTDYLKMRTNHKSADMFKYLSGLFSFYFSRQLKRCSSHLDLFPLQTSFRAETQDDNEQSRHIFNSNSSDKLNSHFGFVQIALGRFPMLKRLFLIPHIATNCLCSSFIWRWLDVKLNYAFLANKGRMYV